MPKTVRFSYKLLINANVKSAWEKHIFEESFHEFKIQSAVFQIENQNVATFRELRKMNSHANQLNHLLALRILPSIELLNQKIYSVIDHQEESYLEFENFKIELLESHINDKNKHQFYVHFISKSYLLHEFINGFYLVSKENTETDLNNFTESQMFAFQKNLSISFIKI